MHLLHVIELPVLHDTMILPVVTFEDQLLKELNEKTEKEFVKLEAEFKDAAVNVTHETLFGPVSQVIVDQIVERKADLVVMGSHGASGIRELLMGSNAEKIVRRSPVPVLVVKQYPVHPIANIVFPNSLETEDQEDLIMHVKALQHSFHAKLHIVWSNTPLNFASDTVTHARLTAFAKQFMFKDYTINIFNYHSEEGGILAFANFLQADLVAMGTHGRIGLNHFINGSLTEDVVNHSQRLIWTYNLTQKLIEK